MSDDLNGSPRRKAAGSSMAAKVLITYAVVTIIIYAGLCFWAIEQVDIGPFQLTPMLGAAFFVGYAPPDVFREKGILLKVVSLVASFLLGCFVTLGWSAIAWLLILLWGWTGLHMSAWHASMMIALASAYGAAFTWGAFYDVNAKK